MGMVIPDRSNSELLRGARPTNTHANPMVATRWILWACCINLTFDLGLPSRTTTRGSHWYGRGVTLLNLLPLFPVTIASCPRRCTYRDQWAGLWCPGAQNSGCPELLRKPRYSVRKIGSLTRTPVPGGHGEVRAYRYAADRADGCLVVTDRYPCVG